MRTARYVTWRDESNQVFHYHSEKAQGGRISLLLELYRTLSQLGTYNPTISAARREGSGHARLDSKILHFLKIHGDS